MSKKHINIYLTAFLLMVNFDILSADTKLAEKGSGLPFSSGETLHYQLSYKGLLTSMIWADFADAKLMFYANRKTPEQQNGHQFVLHLSTENYTKAEMIHPVRYTYTATLDETIQRTILIEKIDTGASEQHEFFWLDWQNKETQLYKKRKKMQSSPDFLWSNIEEVWEKDGERDIPDFLKGFPLLDESLSYLIHKNAGSKITGSQILEPLSMIYNLRTLDIETIKDTPLVISDNIRMYHIERIGLDEVDVNNTIYQAIKYKIQKQGKKDKHFYIWLSNDKTKIPLRIAMEAPLGKLHIQLTKITGTDQLVFGYSQKIRKNQLQ